LRHAGRRRHDSLSLRAGETCRFDESISAPQVERVKRVEERLRLASGAELVLIGDRERARLELYEERNGKRRRLGSLALSQPEELVRLFEHLADNNGGHAPPSDHGQIAPFSRHRTIPLDGSPM
jgi:hypothetical protein